MIVLGTFNIINSHFHLFFSVPSVAFILNFLSSLCNQREEKTFYISDFLVKTLLFSLYFC